MEDYESILCVKNEVFVYRIPARTSNRGYRAAEWKLDEPDWTGRLKVISKGHKLSIKLEDKTTGELFAQCPVESYPSAEVEQVLDSSRYFVIRIQDGSGRAAFIGIGFADRGDSFDLLVSLQDHFKQLRREEIVKEDQQSGQAAFDAGPKLDLGFKEGQTITINITTKKSSEAAGGTGPTSGVTKQRTRGAPTGGTGLLPPPPGAGTRVAAVPRPSPAVQNQAALSDFGPSPAGPSVGGGTASRDLLPDFDFGSSLQSSAPSQSAAAPHSTGLFATDWEDFARATVQANPPSKPQPVSDHNWVNFD